MVHRHTFVSVVRDTRVRGLVSTREGNKTRGIGAATASDLELMAARVELSTRVLVRGVQRDELVADKVVARGEALGDGVLDRTAGDLEIIRSPDVRGASAALLLDLEPDSPEISC